MEKIQKDILEEEHEMNGENEEDWEQKMKEMEKDLERQKEELANRDGTDDPETRRLVQEMMQRLILFYKENNAF